MAARRDLVVVFLVAVVAEVACVRYDLSETLIGWTRLHERLQLDELPAVLLAIAVSLVWFSTRRFREARRALSLRESAEGSLADALAENQRLAQQYADLRESERKALARDLHDELGQYLNAIKLDAVALRDAPQLSDTALHGRSLAMIDNIDRGYRVVADLIRQLRPVGFDELGVAAAIEHCIEDWRARLEPLDIRASIEAELAGLDEVRALAVFRMVQEGLTNIARHAHASRADIRVTRRVDPRLGDAVDVMIADDGRGAMLDAHHSGLGLVGMRERISAFGGSLRLESTPGGGFKIFALLPVTARPLDHAS